jgi:hypothetical protein
MTTIRINASASSLGPLNAVDLTLDTEQRLAAVKALLAGLPPAQVGQFLIDLYEDLTAATEPIPVADASDSDFGAFQEAQRDGGAA